MLTDLERNLADRTFARGPAALYEEGFSEEQALAFIRRPDVSAHLALLGRELDLKDALEARTRHITRRQLSALAPGAVAILAQALTGPQYLTTTNEKGQTVLSVDASNRPIRVRDEPTPTQLRAAEAIMDGIGVTYARAKNDQGQVTTSTEPLFKPGESKLALVADDPEHVTPAQRALSRERIRGAIMVLATRIPDLHREMNENLGLVESKPVRKRKRRPREKASRKSKG